MILFKVFYNFTWTRISKGIYTLSIYVGITKYFSLLNKFYYFTFILQINTARNEQSITYLQQDMSYNKAIAKFKLQNTKI